MSVNKKNIKWNTIKCIVNKYAKSKYSNKMLKLVYPVSEHSRFDQFLVSGERGR